MASLWEMHARKEFLIGTVLYKTKSLDDTKPNTNPKTNPNPDRLFYAYFEHRPMIFKLGSFLTIPIQYSCRTHCHKLIGKLMIDFL